jgi:hypothetical protein
MTLSRGCLTADSTQEPEKNEKRKREKKNRFHERADDILKGERSYAVVTVGKSVLTFSLGLSHGGRREARRKENQEFKQIETLDDTQRFI